MNATLEKALVLEFHEKNGKNPGTVFRSLICYVRGQRFPDLRKLNVQPEDELAARALVGKTADICLTISEYQERTNLHFVSGTVVALKAAA